MVDAVEAGKKLGLDYFETAAVFNFINLNKKY